jgi:hypothetical protein
VKEDAAETGFCNRIGEVPTRRSEPDVIADFGAAGLGVFEVKYGAGNDKQSFSAKHDKGLVATDAFADPTHDRDFKYSQTKSSLTPEKIGACRGRQGGL